MNLDDIIEMASARTPSGLDRARTRRAAERVLREFAEAAAEGRNLLGDLDVEDVLSPETDEAARIARGAQAAQRGWLRWDRATGALTWSDVMSQIFGYPAVSTFVDPEVLRRRIDPADRARVETEVRRGWRDRVPVELTFRVIRPDGGGRYVQCLVELLGDNGGAPTGIVVTAQDVTRLELDRQEHDRRRRRRRTTPARPLARGDGTGLLTREQFIDRVGLAVTDDRAALLITTVQPVGDGSSEPEAAMGRAVAHVLRGIVGEGDILGMLGPYDVGVLLRDATTGREFAAALHQRLGMTTAGGARLRAWSGLVPVLSADRPTGHDLVLDALWAGEQARRKRSSLQALPAPRPPARRHSAVREMVESVVQGGRLSLYAQPIRDLALNAITRHEILLRVRGAAGLPEPPAAFLAAPERSDDILAVDRWVIDHSLALIGQGPQTSHFQINLSARTVSSPGTAAYVLRALHRHGVDPRTITFEITESVATTDKTAAGDFSAAVSAAGCEIALDDFGTGYSSLALIKELPVTLLKIDGSFVTRLRESPADQVIVRSVVAMCRALGIRTAAECVEDPETADLLREAGVDFAQGYAIGHPSRMPAAPGTEAADDSRATG